MSQVVTIQSVLDDAAQRFGDPNKSRFSDTILLGHYNDSLESITRRWQVLEVDASFDWVAGEDRYSYPDGPPAPAGSGTSVQVLRIQYNETPSNPDTWRKVYETTEDRYVELTNRNRTSGDQKIYYWPRKSLFVVFPVPVTTVAGGGKVGYWKQADIVTAITSSTLMEIPTSFRLLARDRMIVSMVRSLGRRDEANTLLAVWQAEMDDVAPRIEDPVDDAAMRVRPSYPGAPTAPVHQDWINLT